MKIQFKHKILFTIILFSSLFLIFSTKSSKAASYIWPIGGNNAIDTYVEYNYGKRSYDSTAYNKKFNYSPFEQYYSNYENHYGVDITGIKGQTYSVVSITDGKVVATSADRWWNTGINFPDRNKRRSTQDGGGYGNYVIIQDSSNGKCFLYGHLKAGTVTVKKGDTVKTGQQIAIMGSSGDSGHMHLHFEVRKNLNSVTTNGGGSLVPTTGYNVQTENPLNYIAKPIIQAKLKDITYSKDADSTYVYLDFDKPVQVNTIPTLNVSVGSTTLTAQLLKIESQKITYIIKHSEFPNDTYGNMTVECTDSGNVVTKADPNTTVDCNFKSKDIGRIEPLAKLINVNYSKSGSLLKVYLNFDKEVIVNCNPTILVQVQQLSKYVNKATLSSSKKSLVYTVDLNTLSFTASGTIYIKSLTNGSIITENSITKEPVNCTFGLMPVGTLYEYKISVPYKGILFEGLGDVNHDGYVNVSDACLVLSLSSKLAASPNGVSSLTSEEQELMKYADVNKDGLVNVSDASIILNYYGYTSCGKIQDYKNAVACDFDNDDVVSLTDYYNLISHFTSDKNSEKFDKKFDLNNDDKINIYDLNLFMDIVKSIQIYR